MIWYDGAMAYRSENAVNAKRGDEQHVALAPAVAERTGDGRRDGRRVGQESQEQAGFEAAAAQREDVERRGRQELERRQEHDEVIRTTGCRTAA